MWKIQSGNGFVHRRKDRRTDGQTDGRGETSIHPPFNFVEWGGIMIDNIKLIDSLVQDCSISSALVLETLGSGFGVGGTALKWFTSYLSQRTQQVQIKGTLSEKKQLTTGVPQGSCLGPVLFTIYVADLFQIIEKHLPEAQGYADDHQVYLSFRPIPSTNQTASVTAIENCVTELRSWMISNMLMVNDSKTEFLIVGSKQQLERVNIPFIHVGEDQITPVTSVRNLGVIFDSNLKMDMQITKACQIAYYHLHNIRRIRKFLSQEATCTIIHAFITSQIDYCNSLMNGLPENLIKKLQRVQNTAARLVFNLRKYDRITPALVTLHWLPVKYRIEFKTLLIVFKGLHGKAPTYIQEMITPSKSKRYSIRSNEERVLKVPKFKHDTFGKRAFAVYGPLAWNCLPKEIRLCDEIEAFKRNLKTHLFVKFVNESTLAIWFWRIIVKRPRMLSAQFVALYKPCKPKPKPKPSNGDTAIFTKPLKCSEMNYSL